MNSQPPTPQQIEDHAEKPDGGIPPKVRNLIGGGIGVVVLAAILFFNPSKPTSPRTLSPTAAQSVNVAPKSTLDQFNRQIEDDQIALKAARARLERTQQETLQEIQTGIPGQAVVGPNGQAYYPAQSYAAQPSQVDPIEAAKAQKEYSSLFASNVAWSAKAKEEAPQAALSHAPETPVKPAPEAKPSAIETAPQMPRTYTLFEGTILETALTNRLEGSFAGPVNCQITTNVYSHDNQVLLIPQGSRILGESKRVAEQHQERLAVFFHRLIMPDGFSVNLDQRTIGLNQEGGAALKDKVDHHYLATFGTSIALGLLSGLTLYGTQSYYTGNAEDAYRQGVSSQLGRDATRILDRQLNRMPDITIREGHRVIVLLSEDMALPAYKQHRPIPGL
jgi:type IV secretory pathway VirB10-like protein